MLQNVIGRGGMGTVWAGRDKLLHRDVAVKEVTPPPGLPEHERVKVRERTLREARAAARIRSPSAVTVFDVVEQDDRLWIVMERLDGGTLEDLVRERGQLRPGEVARIGLGVLNALGAAHAAGVMHRDVKPANVMFRSPGDLDSVVLLDFGIAHFDGDSALTLTGTLLGSPAYLAPERARGEVARPASDVWALGVTLFTAAEGFSPFQRSGPLPTLNAVLNEALPPYEHAGPLIPVLNRLLRRDPAARPDVATARSLLADLAQADPVPVDPVPADHGSADPAPTGPSPGAGPAASGTAVLGPDEPEVPAARTPVPARRRLRGRPLLVGLVAVALLGVALVLPFLTRPDAGQRNPASPGTTVRGSAAAAGGTVGVDPGPSSDPGRGTVSESSGTASTTPSPSPSATAAATPAGSAAATRLPTAAATRLPAGYEWHRDPTGFRIAVPAGWVVRRSKGNVDLQDPRSARYLRVAQTDDPKPDPYQDWLAQEPYVKARLAGYKRISIKRVDYRGWPTADSEFTWSSSPRLHVLNRNVVTGPNKAYALYWSVPHSGWDEDLIRFRAMAATFTPAA